MEEWRDIEGYEGIYQVSSEGRVRSLDRVNTYEAYGKTITRILKGRYLRFSKCGRERDYNFVNLSFNDIQKQIYVHTLVVKAFPEICGEWFEGAEVNHKDENKDNNSAYNLEVCNRLHNLMWNNRHIKVGFKERGKEASNKKEVIQLKDCVEIARYKSVLEASQITGINESSIRHHIYGLIKEVKGFTFKYANGSGKLTSEEIRRKRDRNNYLRRIKYEKNKNIATL